MILRLLGLFLTIALAGAFAQFEFPGLFGKITSRPKAGDPAPEISFTKVLHSAASSPWTPASLNGQVTVLMFLPYISGNPEIVTQWNALVEQFADKRVQFAWITGEKESTLSPFLKEHSIKGWLFHDPDGATGRAYGLETPQTVLIGADRRIVGFDEGFVPRAETIDAALENRITTIQPKPTLENFRALTQNRQVMLLPEPRRMPRPQDHRPDFSPSYAVHIAPAKDELGGGNFSAMDYWSLQGYTVKRLLAEMLDVNPIRIDLPASIDARARYDFSIVLPKNEDKETMRNLIRQGTEDYFHLVAIRENRLRDVYVLTAPDKKPPIAASDRFTGGGFSSSSTFVVASGNPVDWAADRAHSIDTMTSISMQGTADEFCHMLESDLDRPVVNESKLDGIFDFQIRENGLAPKSDFIERLRDQLGLVIAPAQRSVETVVYRQR
jgi:uncharacterized protein (TIGR03435 family)